jgi:hypothetical protein
MKNLRIAVMKYVVWVACIVTCILQGACLGRYRVDLIPHPLPSQDYYGKVIDQSGMPVADVDVVGTLVNPPVFGGLQYGMMGAGDGSTDGGEATIKTTCRTKSDANGLFQFTWMRGIGFGVSLSKSGYEIDYRVGEKGPISGNQTSADDRTIFTMYKLQGAEPMVHQNFIVMLPCDGTTTNVNLQTGKKVTSGGDIAITFTRNPVQIVDRHTPFEWTLKLEISGGGLIETHDIYPYLAPENGYQASITLGTGPSPKTYSASANQAYYFKSADGKYGRVTIGLHADYQPPPTLLGIEVYLNPSGSRNLESDEAK